jgi:predicted amidohydrolase YtcJ
MPPRPGFRIGALLLAALPIPATAADIVLRSAIVVTMDEATPRAEALAIEGGLIVAVGSDDAMAPHITATTQVYDLPGLMVLPGFVDAHNHLVWSGTELEDISLYDYTDLDEMRAAIAEGAAAVPADGWVRGGGWDLSAFPGGALNREILDELVGERPAYLTAADGHSAWVSSKALEIAGIAAETPDPEGGRIERDADGAPTGILREAPPSSYPGACPTTPMPRSIAGLRRRSPRLPPSAPPRSSTRRPMTGCCAATSASPTTVA